jgi:hypothetical protein
MRIFLVALTGLTLTMQSQTGAAQQAQRDANGNPLRTATRTGHVSNYDEAKVPPYKLPELLVAANGTRIQSADQWTRIRRPELLKLYETEIYGKVPSNAPKVAWEVGAESAALNGAAVQKRVVGKVGEAADGPRINVTITMPVGAKGRVPIILCVNFGGGTGGRGPISSGEPIADIIARGWGYASVGYADIQPDSTAFTQGVIGQTLAAGQTAPPPDGWGTISAWAWGISRIIDYFETDKAIDARQVAIMGHSRLGKTVLWAGAQDPRIAIVFSSCAGEMGSSLARRDWGETVDDMAQNFAWQFAGNLQKYPGKWNDMPVDAHMLIALNGLILSSSPVEQPISGRIPKASSSLRSRQARFIDSSVRRISESRSCLPSIPRSSPVTSAGITTREATLRRRPTGRLFSTSQAGT